jgi:hypothetical protein
LKGRPFQTIEEIQENAIRELRAITEIAFQETFQKWKEKKVGNGVSPVEGSTLKGTGFKCRKMSNKIFIAKLLFLTRLVMRQHLRTTENGKSMFIAH